MIKNFTIILKISEDLKKFDDSLKVDFIDNSNIF